MLIETTVYDVVDEANAKIFRYELEKRKKGIFEPYEISLLRSDGENIPCINNPTPIYDDDGKHIGSIGLWTDIKDLKLTKKRLETVEREIEARKQIERQILAAKEQAELANRAKSDFLANMSHELRTPLNAIVGFSEVLAGEAFGPLGNEKNLEYANLIHEAGTQLTQIITDLLDLSRIEAHEMPVDETVVVVSEAINYCISMVAQQANAGEVSLLYDDPKGTPLLRADERHFKQIVLNLLSNAIKFTPPAGSVQIRVVEHEDRTLALTVSDTGIGIAEKDFRKILEPFGQVADPYRRKHSGTGLGLSICKSLVELHRGTLELVSEVGKGTVVTVLFPPERLVRGFGQL